MDNSICFNTGCKTEILKKKDSLNLVSKSNYVLEMYAINKSAFKSVHCLNCNWCGKIIFTQAFKICVFDLCHCIYQAWWFFPRVTKKLRKWSIYMTFFICMSFFAIWNFFKITILDIVSICCIYFCDVKLIVDKAKII